MDLVSKEGVCMEGQPLVIASIEVPTTTKKESKG